MLKLTQPNILNVRLGNSPGVVGVGVNLGQMNARGMPLERCLSTAFVVYMPMGPNFSLLGMPNGAIFI